MSVPESLDVRVRLLSPGIWLALLPVFIIMAMAGVWGWFGRIDTKVNGAGMIMNIGGLRSITAQSSGTLKYLNVEEGIRVEQNQVLGVIDQPLIELEIRQLADKSILLEKQFSELLEEDKKNKVIRADYYVKMEEVTTSTIDKLTLIQGYIRELSDMYKHLREKGIASKETFYQTLESAINAEVNVTKQKGDKYRMPLEQFDFLYENKKMLWDKLKEIKLTHNELDVKRMTYKTNALLICPVSGVVANVMKSPGDNVSQGERVLTVFPQVFDDMHMTAFLPAKEWKKVKLNQLVYISPTDVEPQRYGYMVGLVRHIADYPDGEQTLDNIFKNKDLVQFLKRSEPVVIRVLVELIPDPGNSTGVKWTCTPPENMKLTLGTPCNVSVVVERRPPITYVVPWLKEKLLGTGRNMPLNGNSQRTPTASK
jgi:NHLM bacteriocin system secretion protein